MADVGREAHDDDRVPRGAGRGGMGTVDEVERPAPPGATSRPASKRPEPWAMARLP